MLLDVQLPDVNGFQHRIKTTAGTVTSAAVVMVGAFGIFATLPIIDMKEMGIGLAVAVLLDATIVRAVLLPATMRLLGDWNWYLPRGGSSGSRSSSTSGRTRRARWWLRFSPLRVR